ncbi:MAG: hypothetical protein K6G27_03215 [Lachnospiraceae bacterium]|nr:hypothetical protein [Lachnospiraceae bacterium]
MITTINVLLIILWAIIIPYMLGSLIVRFDGSDNGHMVAAKNISYGFMLMCVLFLIPAVPMILMHVPFHILSMTWEAAVCILCVLSLMVFFRGKRAAEPGKQKQAGDEQTAGEQNGKVQNERIFTILVWIAALIVIAFEICLPVLRMHVDTDDARFLVDAMEALKKDTLLEYNPITGIHHGVPVGEQIKDVTAPFPIFIALASTLFKLHPAITAHTVMPMLFIPLSYAVFVLIGDHIFKRNAKDTGLFLLFLSLIHLFSFETIYSAGYTLLTIIWQGRSVAAMVMLPFLWYLLLELSDKDAVGVRDYIMLTMAALACAMLSNMGSLFAFILCMAYALSFAIRGKSIKPLIFMGLSMIPDVAVIVTSRVLYTGILYR